MATTRQPRPAAEPANDADYPRPVTWAEWRQMPEENRRVELWFGEVEMSPAPSIRHQKIAHRIGVLFDPFVLRTPGALVFSQPVDVRLQDDLVVQPDVLVITGRAGGVVRENWIDGPVDLAVEIVSPTGRRRDLVQKASVYAHAGVPEYWVVDPDRGQVLVHRLVDGVYQREIAGDQVVCTVLDGCEIDVAWLRELAAGDGAIREEPATYDAGEDASTE